MVAAKLLGTVSLPPPPTENPPSSDILPLLVKPKEARRMLACGQTRLYELMAAGELRSFSDGRSRKITVASIHHYIAKRLAA
jgi:hypothetical protein